MPRVSKHLSLDLDLLHEVERSKSETKRTLGDLSSTVEEALRFWVIRTIIAEKLTQIGDVLDDIDGMPMEAIEAARNAVGAIMKLLPPVTKPKGQVPEGTVTNLRDGIDRPAKDASKEETPK